MSIQIIYWLLIAGVSINVVTSQTTTIEEDTSAQNTTEEVDASPTNGTDSIAPICEKPDLPDIVDIEPIKRPGPFPWDALDTLLKNKTVCDEFHQTRKHATFCSKTNEQMAIAPPAPDSALDICFTETKVFEIPKFVSYNNMNCWVLHHWHSFCQYVTCRNGFVDCRGVTAKSQQRTPKCIETNWKDIYYYIICPSPWKLYKRLVRLPQCCSCQLFAC